MPTWLDCHGSAETRKGLSSYAIMEGGPQGMQFTECWNGQEAGALWSATNGSPAFRELPGGNQELGLPAGPVWWEPGLSPSFATLLFYCHADCGCLFNSARPVCWELSWSFLHNSSVFGRNLNNGMRTYHSSSFRRSASHQPQTLTQTSPPQTFQGMPGTPSDPTPVSQRCLPTNTIIKPHAS